MKIKLTVTTIWQVNPKDRDMANDILKDPPADTAIDYLQDAMAGDREFSIPVATAELLKD